MAALLATLSLVASIGWSETTAALADAPSRDCALYASTSGSDSNNGSQAAPFRSLRKLATSLAAGQIGCLQSGETFDGGGNVSLSPGQTHGEEGRPITITSTNPAEPATITHSFVLEYGVNYVTVTHVNFNWSMPGPWACWNTGGNTIPGEVISGPGKCTTGAPDPEDVVQVGLGGKDDSLTYDDITSNDTNICIILGGYGTRWAEGNVFEHDRIHNCGPTVEPATSGFRLPDEEWGWHAHGIYEYGRGTIIKNNYIYDNSRDGILFHGGGEDAVVEHNILDHNGAGIWFGENNNNRAAWNIITNSTSPRGVVDYGIGSYEPGSGNVATKNCLNNNESGEIEPEGGFTSTENKTGTNPMYGSAERHDYTLQPGSPCLGYGPDTAQPETSELGETKPPSEEATSPVGTTPVTPPVETEPVTPPLETMPVTPPVETKRVSSPPAGKGVSSSKIEPTSGSEGARNPSGAPREKDQKHHASKKGRGRGRSRQAAAASAHRRSHVYRK